MSSLTNLPPELKLIILNIIYHSEGGRSPWAEDVLIPLSCTNREWRSITLPHIFRTLNFVEKKNLNLSDFAVQVAPRLGNLCRRLGISLRPISYGSFHMMTYDFRPAYSGENGLSDFAEEENVKAVLWQAQRSAVLTMMVLSMPNLEELELFVGPCRWHETTSCQCLTGYENLLHALAPRSFRSITVHTWSSQDGSDKFASTILLNAQETLQVVTLVYRGRHRDNVEFDLQSTLEVVRGLPGLLELRLLGVRQLPDVPDRTWTCPLQRLDISLESGVAWDNDISITLACLPKTMRHIGLDGDFAFDLLQKPFPSHLTGLESLTLGFTITSAAIAYFRASTIHTLRLTDEDNPSTVITTLTDINAFPCLKRLFVPSSWYWIRSGDTMETNKALLRNTCGPRGIEVIVE